MGFAKVKQTRDQPLLFPQRLDEAVETNHDVRLVDKILRSVDFSEWERKYDLTKASRPFIRE